MVNQTALEQQSSIGSTDWESPQPPTDRGWLWSNTLELWLGIWDGVIDREPASGTCQWLRFYDQTGKLVPLPEEAAQQQAEQAPQQAEQAQQQAVAERERADHLAAHLGELGIDPDTL
jgi:hypothetical protein